MPLFDWVVSLILRCISCLYILERNSSWVSLFAHSFIMGFVFLLCLWLPLLFQPEKAMAPHSSTLAWKSHGWRSLEGCSPWGCTESDTTEQLHFHFSLSCIGEGNGNPLQYSCLENPRTGEPGGLPSVGSHRVGHD